MDHLKHLIRFSESLTDGVIILDSHRIDDVEDHMRGEDEEMLLRFGSPRRPTREETLMAIARWIGARAAGGPMFACALRKLSGVLMGGCEIRMLSRERAAVSYWVYPEFRNRGHATRALALMAHSARMEGLQQLEAHIDANNLASRRVAEKSGFVLAGAVNDETSTGATTTRVLYVRPLGS